MSITALKEMKAKNKKTKVDVASITKEHIRQWFTCENHVKHLFERYFRYDGKPISRFHIPGLTKNEYLKQVLMYNGKVSDNNLCWDTATDYFKRKMAMERVASDLALTVKELDFSSYPWNDDYFIYDDLYASAAYVDNKFMEEPEEPLTAKDCYIKLDIHQSSLDKELFDELYSFCIKAVQTRKVMLFNKIEQCMSVLKNVIEYSNGFSMNISGNLVKTLIKYKQHFETYFEDEEVKQFILNTSDIEIFASDEATHSDYIDTYVSIIRKVTAITSEAPETRDFVKGLIHNNNDMYEDEILDKLYEESVETISYIEDVGDTEDFTESID